jgi:hypothetical protein
VSTARGGEPGAFEPGLEHLIGALTVNGHPHELAGRDAARAAFRAASQQPTAARSARSARSASNWSGWWRRPIRIALPARLAVSIAAVIAVLGGLTAAATAQVLPPQVQQIAYHVLSPLGVPVSKPTQPHGGSASPGHHSSGTGPAASQVGCQCSAASSPSASPGNQHHHAAKPTAKPKAKPKKLDTRPVLRLVSSKPLKDRLRVTLPSGRPGEIVNLTKWSGTVWTTVASAPLTPELRAVFVLPASTSDGHLFKAEVLEGAAHAAVASNPLWIPRAAKTGAKAIQPSPTATPTGTASPSPTPTPSTSLAAATATATPGPTTSPAGTPVPTPTPDPSASATAPATSAPPPTPGPSTSSSGSTASYE